MLYIGTSGFSYDDWKGPFYPENMVKKDMLPFYARVFNTVEVNSTYYAIPGPKASAAMASKTPENFRFAVKLHKDITHAQEAVESASEAFLRAIEPLAEAGKLGCLLAQYPWSFKCTSENMDRLRMLREKFTDLPVIIEFRNAGWVGEECFLLLEELGFGFCAVDEPDLKGLMPPVCRATSKLGYVRFHGRNREKWWEHEEAWQRYDYLYSDEQLAGWVPKIDGLSGSTEDTYLFFNNHYKGKSAANAKSIAGMLGVVLGESGPEQLSLM